VPSKTNRTEDVACPFCGLVCDDLVVSTGSNGELEGCENACERGRERFRDACRVGEAAKPMIKGKVVSQEDAVTRAAQLLSTSQAPMIAGLATDVTGARAALRLAQSAGAGLDHLNGNGILRNQRVLQRTGWFTTTLSEIKNRADLIVLVDDRILVDYPRLQERVLRPDDSLLPARVQERKVLAISDKSDQSATADFTALDQVIRTGPQSLVEFLFGLRQALTHPDGGGSEAGLQSLLDAINASHYTVFVWSAGRLDEADADMVIDTIGDIIRLLNVEGRAAGLPIAGSQGDLSVNQVCTWQTGFPLRMRFVEGEPQADLIGLDSQTLPHQQALDCLLWIDSLAPAPAPDGATSRIVLSSSMQQHAAAETDVYLPVETPGVGTAGLMVRTDNVVTIPLKAVRQQRSPAVARVLDAIHEALQTGVSGEQAL